MAIAWAPACQLTVIDGNDKEAARIAVLRHVADVLEASVSMEPPPADPEAIEAARLAFGDKAAKNCRTLVESRSARSSSG